MSQQESRPRKFRKRPVVIEAIQYLGENAEAIVEWMGRPYVFVAEGDPLIIETLEGDMSGSPGDWIIRGVKGEFYPCKPDIFEATYEPADAMLAAREAGDE